MHSYLLEKIIKTILRVKDEEQNVRNKFSLNALSFFLLKGDPKSSLFLEKLHILVYSKIRKYPKSDHEFLAARLSLIWREGINNPILDIFEFANKKECTIFLKTTTTFGSSYSCIKKLRFTHIPVFSLHSLSLSLAFFPDLLFYIPFFCLFSQR